MGRLLNQIKEPNDIKRISPKLYPVLAEEIRDFLLNNVSQTGGHLASNLGAVEITMALHICLHFPEDKVVYDVGQFHIDFCSTWSGSGKGPRTKR